MSARLPGLDSILPSFYCCCRAAPAVAGAPRKRKKQGPDGSAGASDPASQASSPPGAKKPRLAGPKGKASKADKAQEDGDEPVPKEEGGCKMVARWLRV